MSLKVSSYEKNKLPRFRNVLLGMFLMMLAMMMVDLMAFGTGADVFHRFETTRGVVTVISEANIELLRTSTARTGQNGALHEHRVRPLIEYQYDYQGRNYTHTKYFLVDNDTYSDLPSRKAAKNSVTKKMLSRVAVGDAVEVKVAIEEPSLSYVEFGWPVVLRVCGWWARAYLFLSIFSAFGMVLITLATLRSPPDKT
jgi:Protein of unknown function (DUF3592)